MKLCTWLKHRRDPTTPPAPRATPSEATRARLQAERELARVQAETPKYKALAMALVEIQRTNHLGQRAAQVLRGEK